MHSPMFVASADTIAPADTTTYMPEYRRWLPGTHPQDTTAADSGDAPMVRIEAVARTYGDSITLRWAIGSYPEFVYLARHGVNILRHTDSDEQYGLDTIAHALKPLSLDDFRRQYPDQADSLAYLAMGSLYGEGGLTPQETNYYSSSPEALLEVAEDQKMNLMAAFHRS